MKRFMLAVATVALLAGCSPAEAPAPEAPAAPQSPFDQIQAQSPENQLVTAYQALVAAQQADPALQPPCTAVRGTESRGIIPDNVAPDSIYAAHAGAAVFSVQCGALISATRMDPREHWLVVYAPNAEAPAIVNCANAEGVDQCPGRVPVVEAAAPAAP